MRRMIIVVLCGLVAATGVPGAEAGTATRHCGSTGDVVQKIRATGTTCKAARRLTRTTMETKYDQLAHDETVSVLGYRCRRTRYTATKPESIRCINGSKRVTWDVHPIG